jgi:hypothetical protein
MATTIKQAEKVGKTVATATLGSDGSISLTFADGNEVQPSGNPWDTVLRHDTH